MAMPGKMSWQEVSKIYAADINDITMSTNHA